MPALTEAATIWTDEALMALPEGYGKFELINGELTHMSPAGYSHEKIAFNIAFKIRLFVESRKLGDVVGSSAGFRLDKANVLSPDAAYISLERRIQSNTPEEGFFRGVPDLVVEVISPSERKARIQIKVRKYFVRGTRLVWLAYPRRKAVEVYTAPDAMNLVQEGGALDGGDVLSGFRLPLSDIFDWF